MIAAGELLPRRDNPLGGYAQRNCHVVFVLATRGRKDPGLTVRAQLGAPQACGFVASRCRHQQKPQEVAEQAEAFCRLPHAAQFAVVEHAAACPFLGTGAAATTAEHRQVIGALAVPGQQSLYRPQGAISPHRPALVADAIKLAENLPAPDLINRQLSKRWVEQLQIGAALLERAKLWVTAQKLFADSPQGVGFSGVLLLALLAPLRCRITPSLGFAQYPGAQLAGGGQGHRRAQLGRLGGFSPRADQCRSERELHRAPIRAIACGPGFHPRGLHDQIQPAAAGIRYLTPIGTRARLGDADRGQGFGHGVAQG